MKKANTRAAISAATAKTGNTRSSRVLVDGVKKWPVISSTFQSAASLPPTGFALLRARDAKW